MNGQAYKLEYLEKLKTGSHLPENRSADIISIVSGKGGTGKTFFAANIAYALSLSEKKVLLVDADDSNPNLHIALNEAPGKTLDHLLNGSCITEEAIFRKSDNLHIIFGNLGQAEVTESRIAAFSKTILRYSHRYDFVILDTGSGINAFKRSLMNISDEVIVVANPEPTSVMDVYAIVKFIATESLTCIPLVLFNKCYDDAEGLEAYKNLSTALQHFLRLKVELIGLLPFDRGIHKSTLAQEIYYNPKIITPACNLLNKIAGSLISNKKRPTVKTR